MLLIAAGILGSAGQILGSVGQVWAGGVEEPAGYRMDDYRAPVPETLQGAKVVTTEEAEALWREKEAVFFDVMPNTPKPAKLPAGTIWKDKIRKDIPGSIWLANVGYGAISDETASYFRQGLAANTARGQIAGYPVLLHDRLLDVLERRETGSRMGLQQSVIWYPLGTDGWESANLPLEENRPYTN